MAELERKLKADKKNIKKVEVVANKGIKDELHLDTENKLSIQIRYNNGWFEIPFIYHKPLRDLTYYMSDKRQDYKKIFNADKVIDIVDELIAIKDKMDKGELEESLVLDKPMFGWIMWVSKRDKNGVIMDKEGDPKNSNEFVFDISTMAKRSDFDNLKSNMKVEFTPQRLKPDNTLVAKKVEIV